MTDPVTDRHVARYLPSVRFGAVTGVQPIHRGMSGAAVYAVTTEAGEYVLRVMSATAAERWTGRLPVQRLVSAHGIAPALVAVEDDGLATVSVRVSGPPFSTALRDASTRRQAIGSLVEVLTRLHALPVDGVPLADPVAAARSLWGVQRQRPGFPAWTAAVPGELARIDDVLRADPRRVVSHNDVNPANVLWDGARVWLVDWDSASLNHPYYDLASVAVFLSLPDEAALALVAAQEAAPLSVGQADVFGAIRRLATIFYGATFLELVPDLLALPDGVLDTPLTPAHCFAMIASGTMDLRSPETQATLGAALLRLAVA